MYLLTRGVPTLKTKFTIFIKRGSEVETSNVFLRGFVGGQDCR